MIFSFKPLEIPEVVLVRSPVLADDRGYFAEVYKQSEFARQGIDKPFVQFNLSVSKRGVLRGLHYQLPPAVQGKLIRVAAGKIFDVAVDVRRGSRSFGRWVGVTLAAEESSMLYVPEGFAHGFCVLSEQASVQYFATAEYAPEQERGIIWNDPDLAIDWPVTEPILSEKDKGYPSFKEAEVIS